MADGVPKNGLHRGTGEIPLSWAVPAEAVSDSKTHTGGSRGVFIGIGVVVFIAAVVGLSMRGASTGTTPTTPTTTAPPTPIAAPPTPAVAAPEPAPVAEVEAGALAVADNDDPPPPAPAAAVAPAGATAGPTDDDRATAQTLISRARIAARDRLDDKALALAERSVEADPTCSACWKTLGFLRARAGDRAGARIARARGDALLHAAVDDAAQQTK